MEIRVRLEAVISLQDGKVNINEILHALAKWGNEMTIKVAEGAIDAYQRRVVELLCSGQGRENWLPHEVQSRRGTWDASRPSGYDNPMIGLTKEMQAFRQFLQNLVGNGGITKVLSFSG